MSSNDVKHNDVKIVAFSHEDIKKATDLYGGSVANVYAANNLLPDTSLTQGKLVTLSLSRQSGNYTASPVLKRAPFAFIAANATSASNDEWCDDCSEATADIFSNCAEHEDNTKQDGFLSTDRFKRLDSFCSEDSASDPVCALVAHSWQSAVCFQGSSCDFDVKLSQVMKTDVTTCKKLIQWLSKPDGAMAVSRMCSTQAKQCAAADLQPIQPNCAASKCTKNDGVCQQKPGCSCNNGKTCKRKADGSGKCKCRH